MKALLLIPLITALAYAQDADLLELRGIVLEIGPNTPLAGAQITVYQFDHDRVRRVFASTVTDSGGAFQIKPTLPGDYYVEASNESVSQFVQGFTETAGPGSPNGLSAPKYLQFDTNFTSSFLSN
jgi:hypothetical protein